MGSLQESLQEPIALTAVVATLPQLCLSASVVVQTALCDSCLAASQANVSFLSPTLLHVNVLNSVTAKRYYFCLQFD